MDILYLLVPLSVFAMLGILGVFAWALQGGQFDDLEDVAAEILEAGDRPLMCIKAQRPPPQKNPTHLTSTRTGVPHECWPIAGRAGL
ncbi:MAG: cytochrome oxidase maturation protein, cbb3-type [Burkholderiales bacterium 28-67-8]|nr:MAG: cytochrome oxidase maturation protein, cbb3-type [Burkholderiales bacterium 28-67-8]